MSGRILAIGDVHGCHRALVTLLGMLSVKQDDTVVFLGDAVDRGPASRDVVDEILALRDAANVIFIMGNHVAGCSETLTRVLADRPVFDQFAFILRRLFCTPNMQGWPR